MHTHQGAVKSARTGKVSSLPESSSLMTSSSSNSSVDSISLAPVFATANETPPFLIITGRIPGSVNAQPCCLINVPNTANILYGVIIDRCPPPRPSAGDGGPWRFSSFDRTYQAEDRTEQDTFWSTSNVISVEHRARTTTTRTRTVDRYGPVVMSETDFQ